MPISNNEIKLIKSLSQKKFRDRERLFTVEGHKMVEEAVKSGFDIVDIYRKDEIGEERMSRISLQSSPSPVLRQPLILPPFPSPSLSKFMMKNETILLPQITGSWGTCPERKE